MPQVHHRNVRLPLLGLALCLLITGCHGMERHTIRHGDRNRVYYLHKPKNVAAGAVPLVIMLHGAASDGPDAAIMTRMNEKADSEGFLVAYPNGTGWGVRRTWNAGVCCGPALEGGVDDVGFIEDVLSEIESGNLIDPKRIYVGGFSNGAMLANRVGCQLAGRVAAIAAVAGTFDPSSCQPSAPVSVIAIHGTADELVDYDGGQFPPIAGRRSYVGAADATSFWKAQNHCAMTSEPVVYDNVRKARFSRCDDGAEVVLYTIEGGNHSWPGGRRVSIFGGAPSPDLPATDLIWEFFAAHPKH